MSDSIIRSAAHRTPPNRPRWVAWLELLRLPNIFTAVADVMMGFLVVRGTLEPAPYFALLLATSMLLYFSGIVLNDAFDAAVDAEERPQRPIPSGRVPLAMAHALGWALLTSGLVVGWLASFLTADWRPGLIGTLLAASIALYDGLLKQTPLGPVVMGVCRMLNVLLGMSLASSVVGPLPLELAWISPRPWTATEWGIAAGVGVYIAGVTWLARTDARTSARGSLAAATLVLLAGLGLIASLPAWTGPRPALVVELRGWYLLWIVLGLIIARRCVLAIIDPRPARVGAAVRHSVHSLIVLDAAVALGFVGPFWGLAVLLLLAPTLLATAWLDAT